MRIARNAAAALVVMLSGWPAVAQAPTSAAGPDIAAIQAFEARYLKTVDDGDVKAQLELVSRDPTVHSIIDGEIWRGWDAIKSQAEAYVPIAKVVRNVVDKVEVVSLGPDIALVIMEVHSERRDPANAALPNMMGILTHVLQRTPEGWQMLEEHFSTKLTPEFIEFQAAMLAAQKKSRETAPAQSKQEPPPGQ